MKMPRRKPERERDRLKINATADGSEQGQAAAASPFPLLLLCSPPLSRQGSCFHSPGACSAVPLWEV